MSIIDRAIDIDIRRREQTDPICEAMRDMGPFLLALVPFALVIGAASSAAGLSFTQALDPGSLRRMFVWSLQALVG